MTDGTPIRTVRMHFLVGMEWQVRADSDEEARAEAERRFQQGDADEVLYDRTLRVEVLPLEESE